MIKLVFPNDELASLAATFRQTRVESFALILARPVEVAKGHRRLLVRSVHVPADDEYEIRSRTLVRPTAAFRLPIEKRAHNEQLSIIYCHSHPGQRGQPKFSETDRRSEENLRRYARERVPGVPHGALLIGADAMAARELGTTNQMEVWQIGRQVARYFPSATGTVTNTHDRQVRAFGKEGQRAIQSLRIAIVGCGGTGSIVAQELAHLGVRRFLLIDPDRISKTNLNRVVGAAIADVGRAKVEITKRMIQGILPSAEVDIKEGDILDAAVGKLLLDVDLIFCCTDSEGSRHFLNQLAYQYFIPVIDMGVSITPHEGRIVGMDGRTQMLAPGLACLICVDGTLNGRKVMWDLQNKRQQKADPYFRQLAGVKQPSVISLNGVVASQAVTLLLAAVAGIPIYARLIRFRSMRGDARVQDDTPHPGCANCSEQAYLGKGDLYSLPERSR